MINIQPISVLRDYNKILNDVKPDEPVYLSRNGKGEYAIVDLKDYEEFQKYKLAKRILAELNHAEESGFVDNEVIMKRFGL